MERLCRTRKSARSRSAADFTKSLIDVLVFLAAISPPQSSRELGVCETDELNCVASGEGMRGESDKRDVRDQEEKQSLQDEGKKDREVEERVERASVCLSERGGEGRREERAEARGERQVEKERNDPSTTTGRSGSWR